MEKVYRIYRKYETDVIKDIKELYECLNKHYISVYSYETKYKLVTNYSVYEIPIYEYSEWKPEENDVIIPEFKTEDEAVEFMLKHEITGFVALTIERN